MIIIRIFEFPRAQERKVLEGGRALIRAELRK